MRIHAKIENQLKITDLYTAFKIDGKPNAGHKPKHNFKGEAHDFWEIVIVLEGKAGAIANNELYYLKKGNCIIHEPAEFHRLWIEGEEKTTIIVFTFSAENVPELLFKVFEVDKSACRKAQEILSEIKQAFNVQGISVLEIDEGYEIMANIATKKLELFLLETIAKQKKEDKINKPKRAKVFGNIVKKLEANIDKNLSVSEIAKLCNISESYLQKIFIKYVETGVITYFNRMKMTYAILMFQDGLSVSEVSERLGFLNPNYFSVAFKRIIGKNPSFYKNSYKQQKRDV